MSGGVVEGGGGGAGLVEWVGVAAIVSFTSLGYGDESCLGNYDDGGIERLGRLPGPPLLVH